MDEIKKKAIAHYDRMIEWAEKQNPDNNPSADKMRIAIDEDWFAESCSYCEEYCKYGMKGCDKCPLYTNYKGCCNGRWIDLSRAVKWSSWIRHAKRVRAYIKKV